MRILFSVATLALVSFGASGQEADAPPMARATVSGGFGSQSNVWLLMQQIPAYTDNTPRPVPGEVASRTYQRYLKSFTYPIPQNFDRQSFSSSSSGGFGSSSSSGSSDASSSGGGSGY